MERGWAGRRWIWAVAAITVVGFALRLWAARRESIFLDEVSLGWLVSDRPFAETRGLVEQLENTPILGFLLSWLSARASSAPEAIRAPSLIAGTLTIPVAAGLARACFGRSIAVGSAALVACSPFLNFFSVEARPYALACLLSLLATLALVHAARDGASRLLWAGWAAAAGLAMLSHYTAIFAIGAGVAWAVAFRPPARLPLAVASALAAVGFALIWWGPFAEQLGHSDQQVQFMEFLAPVTAGQFARISATAFGGRPIVPLSAVPGTALGLAIALLALVGVAAGLRGLVGEGRGPAGDQPTTAKRPVTAALASAIRSDGGAVAAITILPPVCLIAASIASGGSFMLARNAIAAVPGALILVQAGFSRLGDRAAPAVSAALAACLLAATIVGTVDWPRPLMREAADAIASDWKSGDSIVEQTYSQQPLNDRDLAPYLPATVADSIVIARIPQRDKARKVTRDAFAAAVRDRGAVFVITPTGAGAAPAAPPPGSPLKLAWTKTYGGAGPLTVTAWQWRDRLGAPPEEGSDLFCHGRGGTPPQYRSSDETRVEQAPADSGLCEPRSGPRPRP